MESNNKNGSLSRKILLYTSTMATLPLILVTLLGYQYISKYLTQATLRELDTASSIQAAAVSDYFERMLQDLAIESQRSSNVSFLESLSTAYKESEDTLSNFTQSFSWALLEDNNSGDLKTFWSAYDYYDVFLIDPEGNILFTLAKKIDLGTNILTGKYSNTKFSTAVKRTLTTGDISFSDLEMYPPSGRISGFLTSVLVNEFGDIIGVLAFQISDRQLNEITHTQEGSNSSLEVYLTGTDLIVRTKTRKTEGLDAFSFSIETPQTKAWLDNHIKNNEIVDKQLETIQFNDVNNQTIIGLFKPIQIANVPWVMVAEISKKAAFEEINTLVKVIVVLLIFSIAIISLLVWLLTRSIVDPIITLSSAVREASEGNFQVQVAADQNNELGLLAEGFNIMVLSLNQREQDAENNAWLENGSNKLNEVMRGEQDINDLSRNIITFLCKYVNAQVGALYVLTNETIKLKGSFAFKHRKGFNNEFNVGEGIIGQAALEKQHYTLTGLPDNYMTIDSGLGNTQANVLSVHPILWNDNVVAILEFASLTSFPTLTEQLLDLCSPVIAIGINTTLSRDETRALLETTQQQAEELQAREEELRESNNILESQSLKLEKSAAELEEKNTVLQSQQDQLKETNEELEKKAQELQTSQSVLEQKNNDLDLAKVELERKAQDLSVSSKYKSEFLANMSHELRTPLNSLLILAKILSENKDKNLNDRQIEYASTIHDSGTDLLKLINDILDLSKIEAGRMEVVSENVRLDELANDMERMFHPQTEEKGIELIVNNLCEQNTIISDGQKLRQIIKNLLSNALKFTEKGSITLRLSDTADNLKTTISNPENYIYISVSDTGIGIPQDKQQAIFEAFQQADGSTNRKFGGTGLGLSISRELAHLLGGNIQLTSESGKGSTFLVITARNHTLADNSASHTTLSNTLINEDTAVKPPKESPLIQNPDNNAPSKQPPPPPQVELADDRHNIKPEDRSVLIIEDDIKFASILTDIARAEGFKVLTAEDGETGLHFADFYQPSGIILDIGLPGIDGWQVIDRLKSNLDTRHIPVHFMSGHDKTIDAFKSGAAGYLTKPVDINLVEQTFSRIKAFIDQPVRSLLVVEDNITQRNYIINVLQDDDINIDTSDTAQDAITKMQHKHYDCIVLDLGLPDMSGVTLLESIRTNKSIEEIPVVIYSAREITREEKAIVEQYANSVIIKSARSPELLLDNTALFLHRVQDNLDEEKKSMMSMLYDNEAVFKDKHILVVDDDMRNVFALTTMLRDKNMQVTTAKNGIEALNKLEQMDHADLILMDIMMPEMDGYEASEKIREQEKYKDLPIIALTAKAMKGDRTKCIKAGANDYLSKPIDTEKLLSMMRVWLYR